MCFKIVVACVNRGLELHCGRLALVFSYFYYLFEVFVVVSYVSLIMSCSNLSGVPIKIWKKAHHLLLQMVLSLVSGLAWQVGMKL